MIVTRTPFRVTLGGGGTDLPSYYEKFGGFIFAMGIDKYMYVIINPPIIDNKIRLHYSQSEIVDHVSDLKHELAREALRFHKIYEKMEISSMADLPAGTGLGSSSCYLIGLLTALHHYRRDYVSLEELAEEACHIELNVLKKRIGKQDQYMATHGGLTVLNISEGGKVSVRSIDLGSGAIADFVAKTHIYYTGLRRDAVEVLSHQDTALRSETPAQQVVLDSMHRIKELGLKSLEAIESENFDTWGEMLHDHWESKKRLSHRITVDQVDKIYDTARKEHHVLGGKIIGAGGGGFLMLYCAKNSKRLEQFMEANGMPRLHYTVEAEGAKVVASLASSRALSFHPQKNNG
ncbi:MAG: galactokinase [Deltaproteobacteria bacterium]|nr:galactokinase [Deltaproteobacteria bacterium]